MALYENIFLARQDISSQQMEALMTQFKDVVESKGGKVAKTEYWGIKSLAYRIAKNKKAHYALIQVEAPHAAVAEMERQMRLNEDVMRFMTVSIEVLEEGPSVMMQKRERDERRRREEGDYGLDGQEETE